MSPRRMGGSACPASFSATRWICIGFSMGFVSFPALHPVCALFRVANN
jgi:hypothetical protein